MKLIKRSIVQNEVAQNKKQQIDEGITIARKIDALRQTLGSLEQQHERFISGMEAELQERTKDLVTEIARMKLEIQSLEEKRAELIKPLDAEWRTVHAANTQAMAMRATLEKGLAKIKERDVKSQEKYEVSKQVTARVKMRERELIKIVDAKELELKEAQEIKEEAVTSRKKVNDYVAKKTQETLSREAAVAVQERENEMFRTSLLKQKEELSNRELLLKDREQTLERDLERNKLKLQHNGSNLLTQNT